MTESRKPISRRLRYEILRRDDHTCRYCGGRAPDVALTVDHVVPAALGGTDDPSNLTAACRDCNAGKSSSSPDAATVAQVNEDAARWSRAIQRAMEVVTDDLERGQHLIDAFDVIWREYHWGDCHTGEGLRYLPRPSEWRKQVASLADEPAVTPDLITESVQAAMRAKSVEDRFFYFFGVVRNKVAAIHEAARRLIDEGVV
jgi:hypothetical protein